MDYLFKVRKIAVSLILIFISITVNAKNENIITKRKADFIIDIATKISYPAVTDAKSYKIGIYGKGKAIRTLFEELESREEELTIRGVPVELLEFKNIRSVETVDLLYLAGDSKIRISDLNEKLNGHPYIIVTENFPFGTSMLNFAMDKSNELFYEIQKEAINSKGAVIEESLLSSHNRITSEKVWEQKLEAALQVIDMQEDKIEEQTEEIVEKTKVINYQRIAIFVAIVSILMISGLGLVLWRINRQKKEALKNIVDSIVYAKRIQNGVLPTEKLIKEHLPNSFILYKPKDLLSGDFYWLEKIGDKVFFAVADCTGHGVPGAILSVMCINSLNETVKELGIYEPGKILDKTTEILESQFSQSDEDVTDGMDIALCCFDVKTKQLDYAGSNNSLYYIQNEELNEIKPNRQPIGKYEYREPYTNHTINITTDTRLYIFSDGYVDQFGGPKDKKYSYKRFRKTLLSVHHQSMEEQKEIIDNEINTWRGNNEQIDDICVMGLKI